jgi:peroxin-3
MLTRVQLNLLGRRSYLSSVVSLATGSSSAAISLENNDDDNSAQAYGDDFEVNRKYLTFSWWLLNRGWLDVAQRVEAAVRQVFGQTSPRDQLSLETFSAMTGQVRRLVEGSAAFSDPAAAVPPPPTKWLPFLLPPPDMEEYVLRESGILDDSAASVTRAQGEGEEGTQPPEEQQQGQQPPSPTSTASLRRLLDETSDLIEAPAFTHVLMQILDAGFTTLLETKLAQGAFDIAPNPIDPAHPTSTSTTITTTTPPTPSPTIDATTGAAVVGPEQLRFRRRAEHKVLLPKCLSVLTRQAHAIGAGAGAGADGGAAAAAAAPAPPPNEYLQAMESVRDLEGFAALVYSSNWENEVRDEMMMAPAPPSSSLLSSASATAATTTTAAWSGVRQSQVPDAEGGGGGGGGGGAGEESLVLVDPPQGSFESAWARATEKQASS